MPMRPVTVRRWEVGAAVMMYALLVTFVIVRTNGRIDNIATQRAKTTSKQSDINQVICQAVNESRQINNRDRQTFEREILGQNDTYQRLKILLPGVRPDTLRLFVQDSVASAENELRARPFLPLLDCKNSSLPKATGG